MHRSASWVNIAKAQESEDMPPDAAEGSEEGSTRIIYLEKNRAEQEERNRTLQSRCRICACVLCSAVQ